MNTAKRQRGSSASKGKALGSVKRMGRLSPMPRDPFHALPPPDRKKFIVALRKHLRPALESLKRFSDSIAAGYPDWPSSVELSLFIKQIETFRLIGTRSTDATPMEVIRDMDHRWSGLHIVRTLERVVCSIESYVGQSLLAEVHAEAIKRRRDLKQSELHMVVYKQRTAEPADLKIMAQHLPNSFLEIGKVIAKELGAASQTSDKLQRALARSAQEYLFSRQQAYLARLQAARTLRTFIHQLRDRDYSKRLHGFDKEHRDQWDMAERRAVVRERVQRFRNAKKSAG
jgi:hypothetical protein